MSEVSSKGHVSDPTGIYETTPTRRNVLAIAGTAVTGWLLSACSLSPRSPEASASPAPQGSNAAGEISPTPSPERPVPPVTGKELHLNWFKVINPDLAQAIRREGEDLPGDPRADDRDLPRFWPRAAALAVPLREVTGEDIVNIAWVTQSPYSENGSAVHFAYVPKDQLGHVRAKDVDGHEIDALGLRLRLGHEPTTAGFVSGIIDNLPDSGWAAESTRPVAVDVSISDPRFEQFPLV